MKKILTLTVLVAAAVAMTFTACRKYEEAETTGEMLEQAIDNTNFFIDNAIKDMQK